MSEQNLENKSQKRHIKRIRKLIFTCFLTCIVLIASTYAWFIGMQEVNVESFEVEIAAADSLQLSLNGKDWDKTISFDKSNLIDKSYTVNKDVDGTEGVFPSFNWPEGGLFPISTIGDMDNTVSRMILFEKASVATTPGGYRLLASRINNYGAPVLEGVMLQKGYLAFDLFIRNYSGTHYIQDLNPLDEEPVYLTTNSSVGVGTTSGVEGHGIENSVRVAFAQIGRVNGFNKDHLAIQGITCANSSDDQKASLNYVTGICRNASIWEPNDLLHEDVAIKWYEKICRPRIGEDIMDEASYDRTKVCKKVENNVYSKTYSIKGKVLATDNIDVYDGDDFNGYPVDGSKGIIEYDFFTDSEKLLKGTKRPTFLTLAPNSITKVRVYVYIEGQDIDNFDYASEGRQIKINFGFSKERFTTEDIDYSGPSLPSDVYPKP